MDLHEIPNSPHPHHDQFEIVILVGPDPFTTTIQTTVMEPNTAQRSPINMNVPSSLNPRLSDIIPHVIFVNPGEDIIEKVAAYSQAVAEPDTEICIMSAHGLVGSVALHHSGSIFNYEGQFEIVSLFGNLEVYDNNSDNIRMSYFKVSLANTDSRLLEGVVADKLIAASLVKVIVGSFTLDGKNASLNNLEYEFSSAPLPKLVNDGTQTDVTTQGHSSQSLGDKENNPFSQGTAIYNNTIQPIPTMSMYQQLWAHQTQ
ncbi:AT-hook motif nuclear-localized protein 8 [Medicago truncatula]|uniref:AT-hook motif nuclear-localized protein n=1 Tax=Medicago truncatula TaxID=3880 RepID=G7IWC9_MEDTR|nr:AT-hook motif nuclear-localized protein 8 [Medicago truncatula]AES69180.1 AT hook motif DNA-binding family protein [Medicago truncatula]